MSALAISFIVSGCSGKMDAQTPFQTLLLKANDWELCDATFGKIAERDGGNLIVSHYSPEERVVMLVWHANGLIGNGGFYYLFSGDFDGDPEFRLTAKAFQTIGLTRSHEACEKAFQLFPDGNMPSDIDERASILKKTDEALLDSLSEMVWQDDRDKNTETKLAAYIRGNAKALGHLK